MDPDHTPVSRIVFELSVKVESYLSDGPRLYSLYVVSGTISLELYYMFVPMAHDLCDCALVYVQQRCSNLGTWWGEGQKGRSIQFVA